MAMKPGAPPSILSGNSVDSRMETVYTGDMTNTQATNERPQQDWYWCDTCRDHFYGSAAIIHKGARCYARDFVCIECKPSDHPIDGRSFRTEQAAAAHENAYHDGAQTCWRRSEVPA